MEWEHEGEREADRATGRQGGRKRAREKKERRGMRKLRDERGLGWLGTLLHTTVVKLVSGG